MQKGEHTLRHALSRRNVISWFHKNTRVIAKNFVQMVPCIFIGV